MAQICDKCESKEHVCSRNYGFIGPVNMIGGHNSTIYYTADLCKSCRGEIEGFIKGFTGNQQAKETKK